MPHAQLASRALRGVTAALLVSVVALTSLSACNRLQHTDESISAGPAYLVFVNQSLEQADVFAIGPAGDATRIGTVQPGRTETLTIPEHIIGRGPINIAARLLAHAGALQSGPVSFNPGDRMQATVSSDARSLTLLPAGQ